MHEISLDCYVDKKISFAKDIFLRFFLSIFFSFLLYSFDLFASEKDTEKSEKIRLEEKNRLFLDEFKIFIDAYFGPITSGEKIVYILEEMKVLVDRYQCRLNTDHNIFDFNDVEYRAFQKILCQYFDKEINFDDKSVQANALIILQQTNQFQKNFTEVYEKIFKKKFFESNTKDLHNQNNPSLVYYLKQIQCEEKEKNKNRAERFFSDVHSSPLYCVKFLNALNQPSDDSFEPYVFGGDLSDRSLLPSLQKLELAKFFDIFLNQLHLMNALYVQYCLYKNEKEKIFLLSTLGNHEELQINFYNDKRIFHGPVMSKLEKYFLWTINAFNNTIPVQITFIDENKYETLITSASHALGKQPFYKYNKLLFSHEDTGIYCYQVHLKKNREYLLEKKEKKSTTALPLDQYLKLLVNHDFNPLLWTDWNNNSYFSKTENIICNQGRGFQVINLKEQFSVFKEIEKMNIENMIMYNRCISDKPIRYHSCCGHQHDDKNLKTGFFINFKVGTVYLTNFFVPINECGDSLYFSMCATCLNLYYLALKESLDQFKIRYPEIYCLLKLDFNIENRYENREKLLLFDSNEPFSLSQHTEVINFVKNEIEKDREKYALFTRTLKEKKYINLSKNDNILYFKLQALLLTINNS